MVTSSKRRLDVRKIKGLYICIKVYFPVLKTVDISKTNLEDFLRQAATDIVTILTFPPSKSTPTLEAAGTTRNVLLKFLQTPKRA